MSVPLVSPNKHPIRVDGQVECGQTFLVKSNQKIRESREIMLRRLQPDELDHLHLSLLNIQQVETVILAHGEDLTRVDDPDQLDDFTANSVDRQQQ